MGPARLRRQAEELTRRTSRHGELTPSVPPSNPTTLLGWPRARQARCRGVTVVFRSRKGGIARELPENRQIRARRRRIRGGGCRIGGSWSLGSLGSLGSRGSQGSAGSQGSLGSLVRRVLRVRWVHWFAVVWFANL